MDKVVIGELLKRVKESVILNDSEKYKRVKIRGKNQGIVLRDVELGKNIGTKKQFFIKEGQFLLSKIDARNGAFGIVPKALNEAIITGNFWSYEVDNRILNIEWFNIFVSSQKFIEICDRASSGTTNRRYLDEKKFLNYEIDLPSKDDQDLFVTQYNKIKSKYDNVKIEINKQIVYVKKLKESILQQAIQGKLVPQNRDDEPVSVLLERIHDEKERMIKEKKIKKEKILSDINEEEICYRIPKTWKFERLGNVAITITDGTHQTPKYCDTGMMFLSAQNVKPFKFMPFNYRCVSKEDYEGYIKNVKPEFGDVLLTRVGSNIGEAAVINQPLDFAIYVSLCLIKINKDMLNTDYICLWLNSPDGTNKSISNILGKGTSQGNLNLALIRNFVIPIPPLEEQKRIVEKVYLLMQLCDELEKKIEKSKKYSEKLMESILKETVKA